MSDKNLQDEKNRQPPPMTNPFRDFVTKELIRRKKDIAVPVISPFVRMTSCLEEPNEKYRFFAMGLEGYDYPDDVFTISHSPDREVLGYAYKAGQRVMIDASQLSARSFANFSDPSAFSIKSIEDFANIQKSHQSAVNIVAKGAYPMPGITDVRIERFSMTVGMRARVTWTCYGRQQMEFLRHHFMTVGTTVVLEWGQNSTSFRPTDILKFDDPAIEDILVRCYKEGRKYINPNYVEPNKGNYDVMVGTISNFEIGLDAKTNVYTITTVITSAGEMLWGMKNQYTAIDLEVEGNEIQTFEDYFQRGGRFDSLLNSISESDPSKVTSPYMKFTEETAKTSPEMANLSTYPNDWRFVSWTFFVKDLFSDMMDFFTDKNKKLRDDIRDFIKFYDETQHIEVGNNPYLTSTTPETMIMVRNGYSGLPGAEVPDEFRAGGYFDNYEPSDRGVLIQGIWINAQLIRNAFLLTKTVQTSMEYILSNMNNATAGYWELSLYYDEEVAGFKIIDKKFGKLKKGDLNTTGNPYFVFNEGTTSELLDLQFDAAFPPEVQFQLAMSARLLQNPELFAETLKKYPLLGQTSHYAFGMNWTAYEDIIQKRMQKSTKSTTEDMVATNTAPYASAEKEKEVKETQRVESSFSRSPFQTVGGGSGSGEPEGAQNLAKALSDENREVNHSVPTTAPKKAADILKKLGNPLRNMKITSPFGFRPSFGRQHNGIDLHADVGTAVFAAYSGVVDQAIENSETAGNFIRINHGNGVMTRYLHLSKINVPEGVSVQTGQLIGLSGDTGYVTNKDTGIKRKVDPHLHYEVRVNQVPYDPANLTTITPRASTTPQSNQPNQTQDVNQRNTQSQREQEYEQKRTEEIAHKFGDSIAGMINVNASKMTRQIIQNGVENQTNRFSNNFIAPFPTTVSIQLQIQGISGVSYFDGFLVDKLPYIYENYGLFQLLGILDTIDTKNGWLTQLTGKYRFMYFDGSLNDNVLTTKNQDTFDMTPVEGDQEGPYGMITNVAPKAKPAVVNDVLNINPNLPSVSYAGPSILKRPDGPKNSWLDK